MKIIKTGKPLSERESESLNIYLNEIGKETILSDDEEKQLSQQIMAGGAAAEQAIGKLTSANLRFVVSIAKQYVDRGVAILDLISEGNIGLMKAARSFDGSRGLRFVGYAEPFVRKAVEAAVNEQSGIFRLPKHEHSAEEKANSRAFSVDAPLQNGKNVNLLSILSDPTAARPDQQALETSVKEELLEAMNILDNRERNVVEAFYGIGQPHLTFAEIGEKMGLKRERVRQIRNKAVRKLNRNTTSDMLKAYLE